MIGKIIFIIILILSFSVTGEIYRVYVDREFGFWAVRSNNISNQSNFENKTLSINTGDIVEWVNMDGNDDRVTIVSDNYLWEGEVILSGTGKRFNFIFNSSGYYRFHILENTHIDLDAFNYTQNRTDTVTTYTIIDDDGEERMVKVRWNANRNNIEYLKAVTNTKRFNYQSLLVKVSGKTVGNGTFPVRSANTSKYVMSSGYNYTKGRQVISVNASPTPKLKATTIENLASSPQVVESYQEFTLYELFKRWYMILKGV